MKYLELPMALNTVVRKSFNDPDCVLIEQPDGDQDAPDCLVILHRSQVDDVIAALQRFMANEEQPGWTVKSSKQSSMLLDVERK